MDGWVLRWAGRSRKEVLETALSRACAEKPTNQPEQSCLERKPKKGLRGKGVQ